MSTRIDRYNNPQLIGPGVWFCIHLLCCKAVEKETLESFKAAYDFLHIIKDKFPFVDRDQLNQYYTITDPIERFLPVYDKSGVLLQHFNSSGLSFWAYNLHRHINSLGNIFNEEYTDIVRFYKHHI
jgi:hypothetical protein